jgi:GPH family glycoside/pentoside/hexuronide:cation symporter
VLKIKSPETWLNIRYGGAAFALGMPTIPLLVHLPILYAEQLGLGLTATGLALFFARLFDVVTDPLVGLISDRPLLKKLGWGRRKPLILVGGVLAAIGTVYLLNPSENVSWFYLMGWAAILYLGWTLISIPYLAWGADLSKSYGGRTQVTSIREGFMLSGILLAGAVPALATLSGFSERQSISFVGWVVVALGAVLFAILLRSVQEPNFPKLHRKETARAAMKGSLENRPFILLLSAWFLNGIANGIPAVLFLLYMKHVLGATELQRGLLTFLYFLAGIVGIAIWFWLGKSINKHRVWAIAMMIACGAFSIVPFLGAGDIELFVFVTIITGLTLGADLAIPPSLQADIAEYEYLRSRRDRTGLLFAFWSMATKMSLAVSVAVSFPLLEYLGFSTESNLEENNILALSVIYSVAPIVFKIAAICIVWQYPLTQKKQLVIQQRIAKLEDYDMSQRL